MQKEEGQAYWKTNLKYLAILMCLWFIIGIVLTILFADTLNHIKIAGFPLGFWFAMQGAIILFVIMMFVYVRLMNKLDARYGFEEK